MSDASLGRGEDRLRRYAAGDNGQGVGPASKGTETVPGVGLGEATIARLVRGGAFILDAPETVPAVWGRDDRVVWSMGELFLLVGPSGVGKTTLASQLLKARLGLIPELLGLPVTPGRRRVLYLACDRPVQAQRAMRRIFAPEDRDLLDERVYFWRGPPPADMARHPELLVMLAEAADADTVVIDSLKDVALGLSDDVVGAGLNQAMQLAGVAGVEVMGLHHQRKGSPGDKPKTLADVYGSVWISAGAGSVVLLWGEPGDPLVELSHLKQPAATVGPLTVEHDHVAGLSSVYRGFDLLRFIRLHGRGVTATEVAVAWFEKAKPTDNQRKRAERGLKRLELDGLAHRRDDRVGFGGAAEGARYFAIEGSLRVVEGGPNDSAA